MPKCCVEALLYMPRQAGVDTGTLTSDVKQQPGWLQVATARLARQAQPIH